MKWYSQKYTYDDPWPTVTLAYFLRYPNPYASHIMSCDVISRSVTPEGHLKTSRLLLKRSGLPKWTRKLVPRPESWVIEETEVDPHGRIVQCTTKNLNYVKVLQVVENVRLHQTTTGQTLQHNEVCLVSQIGWGLAKRIENTGLNKVKHHIQRHPEVISSVLNLIRTSRLQPLALSDAATSPAFANPSALMENSENKPKEFSGNEFPRAGSLKTHKTDTPTPPTSWWTSLKNHFQGR